MAKVSKVSASRPLVSALQSPTYEPILISRQSLYSTLAICEQKGQICPSPQCQRSGDRGVCPLPTRRSRLASGESLTRHRGRPRAGHRLTGCSTVAVKLGSAAQPYLTFYLQIGKR